MQATTEDWVALEDEEDEEEGEGEEVLRALFEEEEDEETDVETQLRKSLSCSSKTLKTHVS